MKKIYIYIIVLLSISIFNSCGVIKEFKSLNTDELFKVYATSYREVIIINEENKQPERIWGINVKPLNDSIVKSNSIKIESAELIVFFKNNVFKTKRVVSGNGDFYLQFYIIGLDEEYNNLKDSLNRININTWADKYDITMKIEVNGEIRIFKYVSE